MLLEVIRNAQNGDQSSMLSLLTQFRPLIRKYARSLYTEDAESELILDFIEMIYKINIQTMKKTDEGSLVSFIRNSVYHAYCKRVQEKIRLKDHASSIDELTDAQLYLASLSRDSGDSIGEYVSKSLTEKERKILILIYERGLSAAEIARCLNTTRQNINQLKKRAVEKLRKELYK